MILNDKIKDYKNLKFQLFELRDKVKSIKYKIFDYILDNMQATISYISNLNVEVLCIEDEDLLNWFKKILVDLSKTIDLIYGDSYFRDIIPEEMLRTTKKSLIKIYLNF